jgi:hypothetical protein
VSVKLFGCVTSNKELQEASICRNVQTGEASRFEADALVFAVGITGMQKIIQANARLGEQPDMRRIMNLRGIDVVSTRLWLDERVDTQFPANVLAGFDNNMGSTYFNLNDLQVSTPNALRLFFVLCISFFHSTSGSCGHGPSFRIFIRLKL